MKRPKLNTLRTFEAAGRKLSFSLAAEELNISQAAVSQQIRNLETYLGCQLFVRNHRQLSLNSTGAAYLEAVHEALDRLDSVTDQLFPDRANRIVTLRCTSSIAALWLAPQIKAFQTPHPDIDLRIQTLGAEQKTSASSGVDLEIFISDGTGTGSDNEVLLTSTIIPIASPTLLGSQPRPQRASDILDYALIHVTGYSDDWHKWFRTHGLNSAVVPRGLTVDSSLIALEAAMRGEGIMLGRQPFVDQYLQSGQLVEVYDVPYPLTAYYCLRQPRGRSMSKPVGHVRDWLLELARGG